MSLCIEKYFLSSFGFLEILIIISFVYGLINHYFVLLLVFLSFIIDFFFNGFYCFMISFVCIFNLVLIIIGLPCWVLSFHALDMPLHRLKNPYCICSPIIFWSFWNHPIVGSPLRMRHHRHNIPFLV